MKIEGLDNVLNAIDELDDIGNLEQALGKACALVERSAKQLAPKDTGALRRSITSKIEGDKGIVYTPLEYAPYVEYGTGLYAEDGNGRKEVPWVYVEGGSSDGKSKKTVYASEADAYAAAAFLQSKGLDARVSYGREPHPYLRPALYENRQNIIRVMKGAGNNND